MKTVTRETAKQLKEAGFPQDTYFFYTKNGERVTPMDMHNQHLYYAAPTADEVLDQLPTTVRFPNGGDKRNWQNVSHIPKKELEEMRFIGLLGINKPNKWVVLYQTYIILGNEIKASTGSDNLAEAAALMWLYLKKEGLLGTSTHP